jgi:hypothetical protein
VPEPVTTPLTVSYDHVAVDDAMFPTDDPLADLLVTPVRKTGMLAACAAAPPRAAATATAIDAVFLIDSSPKLDMD